MPDPTEMVSPTSRREWRAWLRSNHRRREGVWLRFAKKRSGLPTVPYEEAVEEALCFGWIDAKVQSLDDTWYRQVFTPRTARSPWSPSNKQRAARLIRSGAMTRAGLAAIDEAKRNGRWAESDTAALLVVPPDLADAFTLRARANFDAFTPAVRRAILGWIREAKKPETRARRIATTARMAAKNLRARIDAEP